MNNRDPRHRISRLELVLLAVIVSVVAFSVFFFYRERQRPSGRAAGAGRWAAGSEARLSGAGGMDDGFAEAGNDATADGESSDFSARSLAMALPGADSPTNADGSASATNAAEPAIDAASSNATSTALSRKAARATPEALDIEAELRRIAGLEWGPEAEKQLQAVLARWADIDPVSALAYAMSLDSRRSSSAAVSGLLGKWAQRDPVAAYEWFKQTLSSNPKLVEGAVGELFGKMAGSNPDWALRSLWDLPTDSLRNSALRTVVNQLIAGGHQDQMLAYYETLGNTPAQGMLAAILVDNWAPYHPETAASWIATLTNPASRQRAINTLISKWGYDNPDRAAEWVASLPRDQSWTAEVNRMLDVWGRDTPDQAAQWVASLPKDAAWGTAVGHMVELWARDAPDKAAAWLLTLSPPAEQLDPAIQSLVTTVMKTNPEGAMVWADTLTDARKRYALMERAGSAWLKKEPARATAYILNSDLPEATKKKLLGIR